MIGLVDVVQRLEDPREQRVNRYTLAEIMFAALIAVVCGAQTYLEMERTAALKLDWLRRYLRYDNGIPTERTFRRVLQAMDPQKLHEVFAEWMQSLRAICGMQDNEGNESTIAMDGKTARGSKTDKNSALHVISAVATDTGLILGQVACEEKSNEITAIPELLDMLDVKGAIVTIDAMGTQVAITDKIVEKGADYVLPVKGNQKVLYHAVKSRMDTCLAEEASEVDGLTYDRAIEEKKHGRDTTWECCVFHGRKWLGGAANRWPHIRFCAAVRVTRNCNEKTSVETRYYIGSRKGMTASQLLKITRLHWTVESMHWSLDVTFSEDANKSHTGHGPENRNVLRHMAYNMLKLAQWGRKLSMRAKQRDCLADNSYLTLVMDAAMSG